MHKSWKQKRTGAGVHCHGCQATHPDDKENEQIYKMKKRNAAQSRVTTRGRAATAPICKTLQYQQTERPPEVRGLLRSAAAVPRC